mgnify:CR=1 FL=1
MRKNTFISLSGIIISGIALITVFYGCSPTEETIPCTDSEETLMLGSQAISFLFPKGTETLVFVNLTNNRDTVRLKGRGMNTAYDSTLLFGDDECIHKTLSESRTIRFVNEKNTKDYMEYTIHYMYRYDELRPYLVFRGSKINKSFYLDLTKADSHRKDSVRTDGVTYHDVYTLYDYPDPDFKRDSILFNKAYGVINYVDTTRFLVIKKILP